MAQLSMVLVGVTIFALTSQLIDAAGSNCGIGSTACDRCDPNSKIITNYKIKVCCPNCSSNFKAGNKNGGERGYCTCYHPDILAKEVSGDCWKGSQCDACTHGKGMTYNGLKLCCANCERSGIALHLGDNTKTCYCRHNGKRSIMI